ncbi:hypothetical protein [Mesomycoplasma molare]|uniref:Lipoprotein n=1 Tax=Mesomycoplasma molare TaxID=171288 RepID=A0ABY5TXL3_9BACT|nr:hypothetical protein [Mesomycoplasma molare]UWD34266.1 hypothetical protein NX772_00325 [Mesomycoplasma molare]
MKNKWLYKIALPTVASTVIAPMIVSCSVEKQKVETAEEKEKRLEHQMSMEIAPNLTKFLDDYYDEEKYYREGRDTSEMKEIRSVKQFKELTSNINHLNDFEKSYLDLYEDIQNFFDNSIHRYTPENLSFEYFENVNDDEDDKQYYPFLKLEEHTLKQEQMFYHKIFQIMKQYGIGYSGDFYSNGKQNKNATRETSEGIRILEDGLSPIINEKIEEFSKKHKDFQFQNPKLTFREVKGDIVIEVALEVEYQNQKLPEQIVLPLTFDINIKTYVNYAVKLEKDIIEDQKKYKENPNLTMKKVKTFAEMDNILKSKDNDYNRSKLKWIKEEYDDTIKDKEAEM